MHHHALEQEFSLRREGNGKYILSLMNSFQNRIVGLYELTGLEGPLNCVSIELKTTFEMKRRPKVFEAAPTKFSWIESTAYFFGLLL